MDALCRACLLLCLFVIGGCSRYHGPTAIGGLLNAPTPHARLQLYGAILRETWRLTTGRLSDSASRFEFGTALGYRVDVNPIPVDTAVIRVLGDAFVDVPEGVRLSLSWARDFGVGFSRDRGVLVDPDSMRMIQARARALVARGSYRSVDLVLMGRARIEDIVSAVVVSHELGHMVLEYGPEIADRSAAITECSADIVAGLILRAVLPRMQMPVTPFDVSRTLPVVFAAIAEGDWTGEGSHPEGTQRVQCFEAGIAMAERIPDLAQNADYRFLANWNDSLVMRTVLGGLPVPEASTILATRLIPSPGRSGDTGASSSRALDDGPLAVLASTISTYVNAFLTSDSAFLALGGELMRRGTLPFAAPQFRTLSPRPPRPWQCAMLFAANSDSLGPIQCLVVVGSTLGTSAQFAHSWTLGRIKLESGSQAKQLVVPSARDGGLSAVYRYSRGQRSVLVYVGEQRWRDPYATRRQSVLWLDIVPDNDKR